MGLATVQASGEAARPSSWRTSNRMPSGRSSMSLRNAERIALVTGSNRGIGLEAARQLARRGVHAVLASRDEGKGRMAADGIQASGGKATFLPLDVSSSESIRAAVRRFGSIA